MKSDAELVCFGSLWITGVVMDKFFSKLEKLDVLMIIFAIIVCLFALVVMYGWPQGDWALGWTAFSAIGGLIAGVGAFYAARIALRVSKNERDNEREKALDRAKKHLISKIYLYSSIGYEIDHLLKSVTPFNKPQNLSENILVAPGSVQHFNDWLAGLERIDLQSAYLVSPHAGEKSLLLLDKVHHLTRTSGWNQKGQFIIRLDLLLEARRFAECLFYGINALMKNEANWEDILQEKDFYFPEPKLA